MNDRFVPKINCRFKIRQDLDGFLGFFQGKGVLTFNKEYQWFVDNDFPIVLPKFYAEIYQKKRIKPSTYFFMLYKNP